jgi:starch synthase
MPSQRLRVLVVASEATPFAKTGGLGDVAGALPQALQALGHDVRVLIPRYRDVKQHVAGMRTVIERVPVPIGDRLVEGQLLETTGPGGVPVYLLAQDSYFDREQLYGTSNGDYLDNCERFTFFCRGTLEALIALGREGASAWRPQLIHANDWQTGLIPVYLKTLYRDHPGLGGLGTLFTLHNLAYQGVFWHYDLPMTGLGWDLFTPAGIEFYGKINFLKGGLAFADLLTTVSRTYAAEIRTPAFGNGLEGVLEDRSADLYGVINGIDYETWNPAKDPALTCHYAASQPEEKTLCRGALRRELGLEADRTLLITMVTRLAGQKGLDLVLEGLPGLLEAGCQIALLGSGEPPLETAWRAAAADHPGRVAVRVGYDAELASRMYAGGDCFLMPSRYEPCGLGQLIALRYGTIPIVRRTGGLADTVEEWDARRGTGTGFIFDDFSVDALREVVGRAVAVFREPRRWETLVHNAMTQDFSWDASAREYVTLYRKVLRQYGARSPRRSR